MPFATLYISKLVIIKTGSESTFDDLDPSVGSLLCQFGDDVICPSKNLSTGGARYTSQYPFIHAINFGSPIQSQLQSVKGVRSFYVECNKCHKSNYSTEKKKFQSLVICIWF